jgi:polysaccharide biosynthesis protein PslG
LKRLIVGLLGLLIGATLVGWFQPGSSSAEAQVLGYRAKSPEYGMNVFVWSNPDTTDRDLNKLRSAGFTWQKSLFQWREIEPAKGIFNWLEADRVVAASKRAGIKIIARLDFQPAWARLDGAHNGPPDNYEDFANFVSALVLRYHSTSEIGTIHAIEVWNEPNLDREWGMAPINQRAAADYVRLLKGASLAAKAIDPSVTIISAGLSPTGTDNDYARPDDVYLQWMYDAGARAYFDVLGAHGPGYKAPPHVGPDEAEADPTYGGHRSFTFRRVEDLRKVMVANGDSAKQIWLLEFGWTTDNIHPSYAWHRVTPEQHAQYLVDSYKWAANNWSPWIGVMALWTLPDPRWAPDREEVWWAVADVDGTDRPAFTRLAEARRSGDLP